MTKIQKGNLLQEGSFYGNMIRTPIRIIGIVENALFPVRYEYKARGYKGLVFTAKLSEVEILS